MQPRTKARLMKALRITGGVVFLILGIAGLVLPVLQGILFLCVSALLFSVDVAFIREWVKEKERRYEGLHRILAKARAWARKKNWISEEELRRLEP